MGLLNLPYELLFDISGFLASEDIWSLQLVCKSLRAFSTTRPIIRGLALDLLRRCRPLPLQGFQNAFDLPTNDLYDCVRKATKFEQAWRNRGPRPATVGPGKSWYKVVNTPPGEDVEWLSPITMSYMLYSTKSGKVICWDVDTDTCLGTWDPGEGWVLWKCRAAYEEQAVYFTMGKEISDAQEELELVLMKLHIPEEQLISQTAVATEPLPPPVFTRITKFNTTGMVLNVFILNHSLRILSAYIWLPGSNTLGLYVVLDWDLSEYIFFDTSIPCLPMSNWSCVYYKDQVVILSEEGECTTQYFYSMSVLRGYRRLPMSTTSEPITLTGTTPPSHTVKTKFVFPAVTMSIGEESQSSPTSEVSAPDTAPAPTPSDSPTENPNPNPCPSPPWYPDSAHFVRQWWPVAPSMPHISCTVILLASHDLGTHNTVYTLTQHYLTVATIKPSEAAEGGESVATGSESTEIKGTKATPKFDERICRSKLWYACKPFEVACISDGTGPEEANEPDMHSSNYRPLIAVDFGHAVWIEDEVDTDHDDDPTQEDRKLLKFVTFPPVDADPWEDNDGMAKFVATLEIPEELDLGDAETINIDQSQGAVIISVKEGKVFLLFYE